METKNGENWSSEIWKSRNIRNSQGESRSMGATPPISSQYGHDPISAGGEDSHESNSTFKRQSTPGDLPGKIVSQLVEETKKQLAYHKQQTELLETRLHELKQIPSFSIEASIEEHD